MKFVPRIEYVGMWDFDVWPHCLYCQCSIYATYSSAKFLFVDPAEPDEEDNYQAAHLTCVPDEDLPEGLTRDGLVRQST